MRRIFICLLLLAAGCKAQNPSSAAASGASATGDAELNQRIEKQVRSTFGYPPYVEITPGARKPSTMFAGYDEIEVKASFRSQSKTQQLLVSKDNKILLSVVKMDLTRDPQAETMAKIDLTGRPVRGSKQAKVTIVVYDDFQCPYCSRMHQTLIDLLKTYGDRVRVIYKDYPLFEIHPWAERAALDSNCLAKQSEGAYWDFADFVHANPQQIKGEQRPIQGQFAELDRITMDIGKRHSVDAVALKQCMETQATKPDLTASVKEAGSLGVEATPAIFINGMKLEGAVPEEELRMVLDKELKGLATSGQ